MPAVDAKLLSPDADALTAEAQRRTGLDDFGPEDFDFALRKLVEGMRDEAELSEAGMQAQLQEIVGHLCISLRMQAFFAAYPEIKEQEIVAPVVIIGLQRTGTSKLFRNIAADPQWNALYTWLAVNPIPPDGWRSGSPDPRLAQARAWCENRKWLGKAHGFYAEEPEMEALLMLHTFMINNPARLMPKHQAWLEQADFSPCYRHLKRQLKFLQWQTGAPPGRRWILKSPPHLLSLNALADAFPDAHLVMTHRHPAFSVGSMFKLTELSQARHANKVDRDKIRECWLRNLSTAIERFIDFRSCRPDMPIIDTAFRDFVTNPLPVVKAIYNRVGARYTRESEEAAAEWHQANPRRREGKFEYSLEEFGATEADIERAFADYLSQYRDWF